jgi:uncharacterized PurR-regulated membrane protein YhhQ (DUF165 family)
MIAALVYLAAIIGTNVAFSVYGPVLLTFVLAGLALVARDFVHEYLGRLKAAGLVLVGAGISALLAAPAVALASAAAFLLAELLDLVVYDYLRRRTPVTAVAVSGIVGSIVDSIVFLSIAFGSLTFLGAQLTGKIGATLGAALVLFVLTEVRLRPIRA